MVLITGGLGFIGLHTARRHRVTSVVHLAVPALGTAPAQEFESTIRGLVNVLEAARQQGVGRVSVASSLAVYANAGPGPWHETMPLPLESATHTGAAKKAVEVLSLHFADSTGLPVVMLRLAAIYGSLYHSMANLPSRLCHAAVRGQAGRATTNGELLAAVNKTGPRPDFPLLKDAELSDAESAYMDISRIREDTGYEPEYDVESGVADYVEWLQLNPQ